MTERSTSGSIKYATPGRRVRAGLIEAVVGLACAILFGVLFYRFAWSVIVYCYDVLKHLPVFGPDHAGTWTFAVLSAVVFTGPVAAVGVIATVVVCRIR
jgi:hypothetical protein